MPRAVLSVPDVNNAMRSVMFLPVYQQCPRIPAPPSSQPVAAATISSAVTARASATASAAFRLSRKIATR